MKVKITGYVQENRQPVTGIIDIPEKEAKRLIDLKVAVPVDEEDYPLLSVDETGNVSVIKDSENEALKADNQVLKTENENLKTELFDASEEIQQLRTDKQKLKTELFNSEIDVLKLENQVAMLNARIVELETQIQQNTETPAGESTSEEMSEAEIAYRAMTNEALIALINERGIEIGKASRKDDYVALLLQKDAEGNDTTSTNEVAQGEE